MEKNFLYEGKAKRIFDAGNEKVVVYYKDDATAFNGEKKDVINSKGVLNNNITCDIFKMLQEKGIETHLIEKLSDREQLCHKVEIIPLEVIIRNKAAGSFCRRYGVQEGLELKKTIFELSYKDDSLGDPLLNDYHALALDLVTEEELSVLKERALKINEILSDYFKNIGITLVDFKLEFGRKDGKILLADEISPDTCRFWDEKTGERLDKDRFRMDLGGVVEGYEKLKDRMGILK